MDVLKRFRLYEELVNKNKEEKNKLESLIFQAKELKTNDVLLPYTKDIEIEEMAKLAEELDDWLYSKEATDSNYTVFQNKSYTFEKTILTIRGRKDEHAQRDQAVSQAFTKLVTIEDTIVGMNKSRPWVPEVERNRSLEKIAELRKWIETSVEEQAKLGLNEDPAYRLKDLKRKLNEAQEEIYRLRSILKEEEKGGKKKGSKYSSGSGNSEFKMRPRDLIGVFIILMLGIGFGP